MQNHLAVWLHNLDPFIFQFAGYGPRWYGLSYIMSGVATWWTYRWLSTNRFTQMLPKDVGDFIFNTCIFGVLLGGRLGWIIAYGIYQPHDHWYWMFEVWRGGMASHGGIIGVAVYSWWYARSRNISWMGLGDNLCVVAPIGLFLVRCANFINGELYGKATSVAWAVQFPQELSENEEKLSKLGLYGSDALDSALASANTNPEFQKILKTVLTPRHPSQLYEAFLEGFVLFSILWIFRTRIRTPRGVLTGLFFILYAALRITGEMFRVPDTAWHVGVFSAGQFLSLFMFLIGAAFIVAGIKKPTFEPALVAEIDK